MIVIFLFFLIYLQNLGVNILHDLLYNHENKKLNVLILINIINKKDKNDDASNLNLNEYKDDEEEINKEGLIERSDEIKKKDFDLKENLKQEVYFHLLPQVNKQLEIFDIYEQKINDDQVQYLRNIVLNYIKQFDAS